MNIVAKTKAKKKLGEFFGRFGKTEINLNQSPEIVGEKDVTLTERLNALIERGVTFNVAEDDFEFTGERLNESEMDFLLINKDAVLCTLQQILLMKHLFSRSDLLSDFAFEIAEAQAIRFDSEEEIPCEIYFQVVSEISKKWFARLLGHEK